LLTNNPNVANPERLDRVVSDLVTCSNDHDYTDEQKAVDSGLMDNFNLLSCTDDLSLDYYDGNTVTALWNYAQHFALNDNSFGTTFGPSTPGAINLISGETHAVGTLQTLGNTTGDVLPAPYNTIIGDPDPIFDDCGTPDQAGFEANGALDNHNIGDLLNRKGVSRAGSRAALRRPAWSAARQYVPRPRPAIRVSPALIIVRFQPIRRITTRSCTICTRPIRTIYRPLRSPTSARPTRQCINTSWVCSLTRSITGGCRLSHTSSQRAG